MSDYSECETGANKSRRSGFRLDGLLRAEVPRWLAVLIVLCSAIYFTWPTLTDTAANWNSNAKPSWQGNVPGGPDPRLSQAEDVDTWLIHGGLMKAPHFVDTLAWLHGKWAGQVVFYRPISSYAFWLDWKLFGNHEYRYTPLAVLLHLLVVWQFVCLAFDLHRFYRVPRPGLAALLSGLILVDGLYVLSVRQATNTAVFDRWKNMPETLVTLFFCLAIRAYLNLKSSSNAVPTAETKAKQYWRLAAPTVWYLAACASKEAGVLLPVLAVCIELPELRAGANKRREAFRRLMPLVAALPAFVVLRRLFLGTVTGFTYGSNGSWSGRITDEAFGSFGIDLRTGRYTQALLGVVLGISALLFIQACGQPETKIRDRQLWQALGFTVGASILGTMCIDNGASIPMRPVFAVIQMMDSKAGPEILGIGLMLIGLYGIFRHRPLMGLFGYVWVFSTLALLAFTPSSIHRQYLVEGGFAIMLAGGWTHFLSPGILCPPDEGGMKGIGVGEAK